MFLRRGPSQIFDVVLKSPLLHFFMVGLFDPEAVFKSVLLFQKLDHRQGTLINFKTSFLFVEHLLMASYFLWNIFYCFASLFALLLRKWLTNWEGLNSINIFVCLNFFWNTFVMGLHDFFPISFWKQPLEMFCGEGCSWGFQGIPGRVPVPESLF